jgi:hypothetical protein
MNREAAARMIQAAFRRGRKPKAAEFVNKFSEFDYALTKPTITSTIVAIHDVPFIDLAEEPLPPGVDELLGYTTTGEKPVVRKIRGRNTIIGANKTNTFDVKRWAFTINFKSPESKAYVSYSDKERLQINTTGPYERVVRLLHKTYLPGVAYSDVKILKIDTKMYINRYLNLDNFGEELTKRVPSSKLLSWSYEPDLFSGGGFLKWSDPRATLVFFTNGTILTLGLKKFEDVGVTAEILKQLFAKYLVDKVKLFKYMRGAYGLNYMGAVKPPVPARKNLAKKRAAAANRYAQAMGWNNVREGFYVRPGANGKPRFYPMVANLKLVRPKVVRAYAEAGVPIPRHVRNALGIENGAAPVAKVEGRRAPNWSATKNGYYVKPGPGGLPYFYKVPKGKAAAKKTVQKAYAEAGVPIPVSVRNLFDIEVNNSGAGPARKQHYVNYNAQGGLRINGKQFSRYTQAELVQIARNLNIPQVNASTKLANIARYIKGAVGNVNNAPDATLNGAQIVFMNNGRVKRGGRARQWATLKPAEQNALARAFLTTDEYEPYAPLDKVHRYQYIMDMKRQRRAQQLLSAQANANAALSAASSASSVNSNFARNLELNLKSRALLGNNAKNANVNAFKAILSKLPKGARGAPLAPNVQRALKNFKRASSFANQLAGIKRNYETAIKVPNWLPANLHTSYKKTLLNLATEPNVKGKLPNKEAVKRGIRGWLNSHLPQTARIAYNKENFMTGEIIRVPGWDPAKRASPNLPNQKVKILGPARVRKPRAPKPNQPAGPHTGPVKKAKKDPRENRSYPVPRNMNAENLVNAIANLGLPIGSSNKYSWTYLANKGMNNRFYQNWMNFTKSPNVPLTVNTAKAKLNAMKTAKARHEWTVAQRNSFSKENYAKILEHRRALENRNKARRAAKREA